VPGPGCQEGSPDCRAGGQEFRENRKGKLHLEIRRNAGHPGGGDALLGRLLVLLVNGAEARTHSGMCTDSEGLVLLAARPEPDLERVLLSSERMPAGRGGWRRGVDGEKELLGGRGGPRRLQE
jgi:hypothetical protein